MAGNESQQNWITKGQQMLAEKAKQEEANIEEIRVLHKRYADATEKLFAELSQLSRSLNLTVSQEPPKLVKNTLLDEYFQISGDLTISHSQRRIVRLVPDDLTQNLVPAAFSGIGVQTLPPNLLPFDELFFAEQNQTWVVRVKTGSPSKPIYETKSIDAEALIQGSILDKNFS